jgi:asparagine synthase (glutamine-hydrolysing)
MCGIAGTLRLDGDAADPRPVDRLIEAMAHRGPDGRGTCLDGSIALGHLRLSILDPTPAGAQPMSRAGTVLIHNGEVYNYLELAEELTALGARITSGTDTEVILAAYDAWGIDAVRRFNGMFAFALWDRPRQRLVLARDRMGVKPLYLRQTARSLVFASEVGAFARAYPVDASDVWKPEPHLPAVHDFLARGRTDHSDATFLDGVTALPAAHLLVVEGGEQRLVRYWGPPALADDDRPFVAGRDRARDDELVEEFRTTFDSAVQLRLRSDVPIGTCLSGGLDSSSIVATVAAHVDRATGTAARHEQVPRLAFHARFTDQGIDESRFAELVARESGVRLVHRSPSASPLLAAVLPVLRAQGEPFGGASVMAQYAVMEAAHAEGLKVLLDGQGADELLGGYLHFAGVRAGGLAAAGHPLQAARELRAQVRRGILSPRAALAFAVQGTLPTSALEAVRRSSGARFGVRGTKLLRQQPRLDQEHQERGTALARHLWQAMTSGLPELLRYEDRNSMAFGIEARVPFLDVRLIELAARLPDRLRVDAGVTKVVLRKAMRSRLPEAITERRDKLGFAAPQRAWLSDARPEVAALLRNGQVIGRGWVEPSEVMAAVERPLDSRRGTDQLWRLFITEAWLRSTWPAR